MKHAWIKQHGDPFTVTAMCKVLQVSTSGYYDSLKRSVSKRSQRHERIKQSVQQVFEESHCNFGSVKISKRLQQRDDLETACRNTVMRTMQEIGLKSRVMKKYRPQTTESDPSKIPSPNKLNQDFTATAPNQKWVTDITYLKTKQEGWVYVSVVLDLFSRKVVGWSIRDSLETNLVKESLHFAIVNRKPDCGKLLHHSDRGTQYTSSAYQKLLKTFKIDCSMSRTGNCYDNAVMERFFWSLKHEWTNHEEYEDLESARLAVFKYIETFYNRARIHQALDYKTPDQYEADHAPAIAA